jgi:flagellar biosynthesis protein FlhA
LYTKLTIGDGLVTQIPALFISLAAGLLVTRSSQRADLPREVLRQLFSRPQVLAIAAGFLGVLMLVKLPAAPLLGLGVAFGGLALVIARSTRQSSTASDSPPHSRPAPTPVPTEKRVEDFLAVDPLELEIGVGLIRLADPQRGGDLLAQITEVRKHVAAELGLVLPKVRIRDNLALGKQQYRIKIAGNPVAEGRAQPERVLAVERPAVTDRLAGEQTIDPASRRPALWIDPEQILLAKRHGYQLLESTAVVSSHLRQVVREHAADLMTRDAVRHLIDELKRTAPAVVEELIPGLLKLGEVQQVLQMLLREGVPVRQLSAILEALGDHAPHTKDPVQLTDCVRQRLARTICTRYRDEERRLCVVALDPAWEDRIAAGLHRGDRGVSVRLAPQTVKHLCGLLRHDIEYLTRAGRPPVVLVSPQVRAALKQVTAARLPELVVLSYDEITNDTRIESVRVVSEAAAIAA